MTAKLRRVSKIETRSARLRFAPGSNFDAIAQRFPEVDPLFDSG